MTISKYDRLVPQQTAELREAALATCPANATDAMFALPYDPLANGRAHFFDVEVVGEPITHDGIAYSLVEATGINEAAKDSYLQIYAGSVMVDIFMSKHVTILGHGDYERGLRTIGREFCRLSREDLRSEKHYTLPSVNARRRINGRS